MSPNTSPIIPDATSPSPAARYFADWSTPESSPISLFGIEFVTLPLITAVIAAEHTENRNTKTKSVYKLFMKNMVVKSAVESIKAALTSLFLFANTEKYDSDSSGR